MKQALDRFLCQHPRLYLRMLRLTGRGSSEKRAFLALLRPGDVVFDVGANRGHFTRLFSRIVGESGAVHAFEPVPATFALLRDTMRRAGSPTNVSLHACALGDEEGIATLNVPGSDDGQASLRTHSSGSWSEAPAVQHFECAITTLDKFTAAMDRLDFVKCDVEGAELPVIRGARTTLTRLAPLLWLEANPEWTRAFGYTPDDLVTELRTIGYDTFHPDRGGNLLCAVSARHTSRLATFLSADA